MKWRILNRVDDPCNVGSKIEPSTYWRGLVITDLRDLGRHVGIARHVSTIDQERQYSNVVVECQFYLDAHIVNGA